MIDLRLRGCFAFDGETGKEIFILGVFFVPSFIVCFRQQPVDIFIARIAELGVSPVHRISYAPVAALQRVDEELRDALHHSLDRCANVGELQAWVATDLRPAYGRLKLVWVETLRRRYADRLAQFAAREGLE